MSKRLILILALAFVVGMTFAAYAEVQNVKVSGDITIKGVARDNFDLTKTSSTGALQTSDFNDTDSDLLSITRLRVDTDLTDNVSATVRLLNERNWNGESNQAGQANRNIGLNTASTAAENEIDIDLAYVTLKEFLYSPLSVIIGRQELHFGNDLILGDPDTNVYSASTQLAEGDLSARKGFDAIRATLDYNPLVVDAIYAKIQEGVSNLTDDVTLGGINASYALNDNTSLEGYIFTKVKGSNAPAVFNIDANANGNASAFSNVHKADVVNTIGVRAVDKSISNLTLDGQVAFQFGKYNPKFDSNARFDSTNNNQHVRMHNRDAMALQLKAAYDLKDIAVISKYSPMVSAGYTYLSGANRHQLPEKSYKGWDPLFENQTEGHIINGIFGNTNMQRALVSAKAKLTDDLGINVDSVTAWFAKASPNDATVIVSNVFGNTAGTSGRRFFVEGGKKYIGQEIDATLTYDYTEDVQLSLLGGIFLPGTVRDIDRGASKDAQANATEIIGSMKVTF